MGLDETIHFVEAKEIGQRSTVQLNSANLPSMVVNKITAYRREQKNDFLSKSTEIPEEE